MHVLKRNTWVGLKTVEQGKAKTNPIDINFPQHNSLFHTHIHTYKHTHTHTHKHIHTYKHARNWILN